MKTARSIGILLIAIGFIMMIITGFNVVTEKKVVDLGPLQVNKTENHPIYWSPVTGGVLLLGGVVLLIFSMQKKTV